MKLKISWTDVWEESHKVVVEFEKVGDSFGDRCSDHGFFNVEVVDNEQASRKAFNHLWLENSIDSDFADRDFVAIRVFVDTLDRGFYGIDAIDESGKYSEAVWNVWKGESITSLSEAVEVCAPEFAKMYKLEGLPVKVWGVRNDKISPV